MFLENSVFIRGIYDTGANISLLNENIAKKINLKKKILTDTALSMVSGHGKIDYIAIIKIKIFNIEKEVTVFVLKSNDFNNDFVCSISPQADLEHLSSDKKIKLQDLINEFNKAFATHKFDTGQVKNYEAFIKLTENRFVYRKPYKWNILDQAEIESQINKLLGAGLIEESTCPFATPVTLALKNMLMALAKRIHYILIILI